MATTAGGLARVEVVAPRRRTRLATTMDVAFADLLPTMLRHAEEAGSDNPAAANAWTLARLGGPAVDTSRTPLQLDVRDGELLYLRPQGAEAPEMLFDDVVDAVAAATRS